ncbi:AAA family ATPase [Actinomadura sp. 21ATH]|uniref:helix-turn-helix transcriptional regulator n=1 Tax=Actinomadura sp. 21ATH TaxID=1735444 RepID=UPI0035C21CD2
MPPQDPPLTERDRDLGSLVAALARPPVMVVVEGEPGAGKTRLVREALADKALGARHLLTGHAVPAAVPCPLGPVIEALAGVGRPPARRLSALTGVLRTVLPDLAAILPPPPPSLGDPRLLRHRLVRAAAELLGKLGPAVLALEDLQWADEATVELLRMIGTRPPPELSVVLTRTPGPAGAGPPAVRLHLEPLSVAAAGRMAAAVLGEAAAMPREVAERLYERSGGVPRAVREDARLLRDLGLLRPADGAWSLTGEPPPVAPRAIAAEIVDRARGLPPGGDAVLEAAAVLAEPAAPELVARVAGTDERATGAALAEAIRRGLLRDADGGIVRFRHELARIAVYASVPGYRRRELHRTAARELTCRGMVVRAVDHHRQAGDLRGWAASAEAAAALAAAGGSFGTACAYLRELIRSGAVPRERRTELAVKLARATLARADDESAAAVRVADAAAGESAGESGAGTRSLLIAVLKGGGGSAVQRGELRLLLAWLALEAGEVPDGLADAVADVGARDDLAAVAHALLATPDRLPGRGLRAQRASLERARAAAEPTVDPVARVVVAATAAHLLVAIGDPGARAAVGALPARGENPEATVRLVRGLAEIADAALHAGHYARGLELAERARRLGANGAYAPRLRVTAARARWAMGEISAKEAGGPGGTAPASRLLAAQIRTGQGRLDEARRELREVARDALRTGELAVAAHAAADFNRVALADGQRNAACALAREVLDAVARKGIWGWAAPLLPFAPPEAVRAVLPRYRAALEGRDVPLARAALAFAEARICERDGDPARAAAGYGRARGAYAALPDPRMAAHASAARERARLAAGWEPDAEPLRHAWSTFTGLGLAWDADRVKRLMREAGLPVPHRRGRRGYGDRLSPREREIADLAAAGHTNPDIAAELCLSDRTVKYHLANAMRKLGVTSRRRLRDALESGAPDAGGHVCHCARCGRRLNLS